MFTSRSGTAYRPGIARVGAVILAVVLGTGILAPTAASGAPASAPQAVVTSAPATTDSAVFTWGLNRESGSGAFFGGCNFLSAGIAGNTGSSRVWTTADNATGTFYRTSAGSVRIEKLGAGGNYLTPAWASKCQDGSGETVTTGNNRFTGNRVVMGNGSGTFDAAANTAALTWDGDFTVVFYGGLTYWTVSDPTLTVAANGTGTVTATASGFGADRDNPEIWTSLTPATVTLAVLTGVDVTATGFTGTPTYLDVAVSTGDSPAQPAKDSANAAYWGSFPQNFVDFQQQTGQAAYWYTSDGARDQAKPATALTVAIPQTVVSSTTAITVPGTPTRAGTAATYTATVTSSAPVGNVPVTFKSGDTVVATRDLSHGKASVSLTLAPGMPQVSASYPGAVGVLPSTSVRQQVWVYFADKVPGSSFYEDVMWLATSGITTGQTPTTFAPGESVSRQAMAAFLFRLYKLEHPLTVKPTCTTDPFTDVKKTSTFCGEITWLAQTGITTGQNGKFAPGENVSRQAMAAFLFRLYQLDHPLTVKPTCTTDPFADVAKASTFCGEITWLAANTVTTGQNGKFAPGENVSRQAMAAFLYRMNNLD